MAHAAPLQAREERHLEIWRQQVALHTAELSAAAHRLIGSRQLYEQKTLRERRSAVDHVAGSITLDHVAGPITLDHVA